MRPLPAPFAVRLAAALAILASAPLAAVEEIGPDDFRLSAMGGGVGDTTYQARTPAVAYNPDDDEYLVVWAGDTNQPPFGDGLWGIFGQRIDAATGDEVGPDDFAITGVIDGDPGSGLFRPAVAYNPDQGEYLVTWTGNTGLCCGGDYEVYARRVSAAGVPIGSAVQVSQTGSFVFVVKDGVAKVRPIEVERTVDNQSVIRKGLEDGEMIVTDGQLLLVDGSRVSPRKPKAAGA